jgi:hypothetical protein
MALGAAPDPSAMGVRHVQFFPGVPPGAWIFASTFHLTSLKAPSRLMKLPECPCKDLLGFLSCTYEQTHDVFIAVHNLEDPQGLP